MEKNRWAKGLGYLMQISRSRKSVRGSGGARGRPRKIASPQHAALSDALGNLARA